MTQAEVNIGVVGHVDHGKTTLTHSLTNKWTDTHSQEIKRGISIKLGYADATFVKTKDGYGSKEAGAVGELLRKVSFLDAPGHETLMATVIAASSLMDGALFVVSANEKCPQPQTVEHLMVLEAAGIKNVVIAQNKVDLVSKERAQTHFKELTDFLKGSLIETAPIIPTAGNLRITNSALIQALEETIPTPKRDLDSPLRMFVARSFDINKPGTDIGKIGGGVIGGSIVQGRLRRNDNVVLLPGAWIQGKGKEHYQEVHTVVNDIHAGTEKVDDAIPGGLVAASTEIDPSLAKSDSLVGNVLAAENSGAEVSYTLDLQMTPMPRLIEKFPENIIPNEPLVLGVGTATTVGAAVPGKKGRVRLDLKKPVFVNKNQKIAVLRRAGVRWRLYATAEVV
ncbi:MAG: translation initiation factor IF-2 subunit gamma [Candidatus Micrarchaeota archaeon]